MIARADAKPPQCRLADSNLVRLKAFEAIGNQYGSSDGMTVDPNFNFSEAGEPFGPQRDAISRKNHNVLTDGIKRQWTNGQRKGVIGRHSASALLTKGGSRFPSS
jgi:hypothetical protein